MALYSLRRLAYGSKRSAYDGQPPGVDSRKTLTVANPNATAGSLNEAHVAERSIASDDG